MKYCYKIIAICFSISTWVSVVQAQDCQKLNKAQCAHSQRCIIDCEMKPRAGSEKCDGRYFCREPRTKCEENWKPSYSSTAGVDSIKNECEKTPGCHFKSAECLCPCDFKLPEEPQCMCACGGGAPPTCSNV